MAKLVLLKPDEDLGLEPLVEKLDRDIIRAASTMTPNEMRFLVKTYYRIQKIRIQLGNAASAAQRSGTPAAFSEWFAGQLKRLEQQLPKVMQAWAQEYPAGEWAMSQIGIGPVLAAGLLAYIDPEKATTPGKVWRFAGLDPTIKWSEGEKRPYCQDLKVLCFRIGDSFVKFSNHPNCFYGHIYRQRKALETQRNEAGLYAEQAKRILEEKRIKSGDLRSYLEQGKLSPGHIEMRARRYAVKMFLAHFQWVLYETTFNEPAPRPYPIEHLGHTDLIVPPNYTPLPRR